MVTDLKQKVRDRIATLGIKDAAEYFGVSIGTVSNWGSGKTSPSIDAVERVLSEEPVADAKKDELVMWEGKKLYIMLPVYRSFNPDTHFTLFANYAKYGPDKIGLGIRKRTLIYESRSQLCHKWKEYGMPTGLFVDDDMILPCGHAGIFNGTYKAGLPENLASINAISRIMSHGSDKGIIGGLYFGRHRAGRAQCASGFSSDLDNMKLHRHEYTGLKKEDWVGTGFMKIERWVLDEMDKAIEGGKWPELKKRSETGFNGYFTPRMVSEGEDVAFCRRAAEIGIQTWLDCDLELLHVGEEAYGSTNTR